MKIVDKGYYRVELLNNIEDNTDLSSNHDKLKNDLTEININTIAGNERIQDQ